MNNTKIIAFSGKKQSGKNTCANFIYSKYLGNLNIAKKINLNEKGEIVVSDLYNKKEYAGPFNPCTTNSNDYIITKCLNTLAPYIKLYSFADPLKQDICMNILGLTYDQCYGADDKKNELVDCYWPDKKTQMTAREVMQYIGTDMLRSIKQRVWTDAMIAKIHRDQPQIAIITDCRFPNEVECIQKNNGVVVRLTRNIYNSSHISEQILDKDKYDWNKFDYIIDNREIDIYNQSLEVDKILKEVLS